MARSRRSRRRSPNLPAGRETGPRRRRMTPGRRAGWAPAGNDGARFRVCRRRRHPRSLRSTSERRVTEARLSCPVGVRSAAAAGAGPAQPAECRRRPWARCTPWAGDLEAAAGGAGRRIRGVGRRFERLGEADGVTLVDDYAHHPSELERHAWRPRGRPIPGRRLVAVFQPHLYSRTAAHGAAMGQALAAADLVVVTEIYGAPGSAGAGCQRACRWRMPRGRGRRDACEFEPGRREPSRPASRTLQPGDVVLTLGAGDITRVGARAGAHAWPRRLSEAWLALVARGGCVLLASGSGPRVLRGIAFFRVRRVEFAGLRYLSADELVPAMHLLARGQRVRRSGAARPPGRWPSPGCGAAGVHRRLPGTLRVDVAEATPVALAPARRGMVAGR